MMTNGFLNLCGDDKGKLETTKRPPFGRQHNRPIAGELTQIDHVVSHRDNNPRCQNLESGTKFSCNQSGDDNQFKPLNHPAYEKKPKNVNKK